MPAARQAECRSSTRYAPSIEGGPGEAQRILFEGLTGYLHKLGQI
jgi:hypothetical protein